jgi:hypothetical protein
LGTQREVRQPGTGQGSQPVSCPGIALCFDLIAVLLVLTAVFGWLNHMVIRLPHTIGLLVVALGDSLILTRP